MKKISFCIAVFLTASASFADTTIYSTGFESPSFVFGSLQGQQGWFVDADYPYNVQSARVFAGSRALSYDTAPGGPDAYAYKSFAPTYNSATSAEKTVVASSQIFIQSNPEFPDSYSWAGLNAYSGAPNIANIVNIEFDASGACKLTNTFNEIFSTVTAAPDAWHNVELVLNFATGTARGKIDGVDLGISLSFPETTLADVDLVSRPYGYNMVYFDNYLVKSISTGLTVSGTLTLGNFSGSTAQAMTAVIKSGSTVVDTKAISVATNGSYSFTTSAAPGTYDVYFQGVTWLAKKVSGVNLVAGTNTVSTTLLNGDTVLDNTVDLSDYTAVITAFNAIPSSGNWNARADLTQDGVVDLTDYTVIVTNFNSIGN
ncbi:MAG: hypothetical protein K8R88_09620 [Armatimonadetes bacterium]|nr:hypothetical protein [Armatimonadota bacterium]